MKKVYTQEEKEQYVTQWQQSGQSKKEYSTQQGLVYDTFLAWVQRYTQAVDNIKKNTPPSSFAAIAVTSQNHTHPQSPLVTIHFSTGHEVSFYEPITVAYLRELLAR